MTARARLVLVAAALLALAGAGVAILAARSGGDSGAAVVEEVDGPFKGSTSPFRGALRPRAPRVDFALRNQDGDRVRLADERGKVVVLSPMYTICRDTCPIVAQQIRGAIDDLTRGERAQVRAHALSVDPANDSPRRARTFLAEQRVLGYLDFLLGSLRDLKPVWHDFGFARQTAAQEHNSYVVLIDRGGHQRVSFPVDYLTPEGLTHDLKLLVADRSALGGR